MVINMRIGSGLSVRGRESVLQRKERKGAMRYLGLG